MSGECYSCCCSDSSKSHSFSCESPSPGLHARTKDYKEGRFLTAYKSNIHAWVQTARRILQLMSLWARTFALHLWLILKRSGKAYGDLLTGYSGMGELHQSVECSGCLLVILVVTSFSE